MSDGTGDAIVTWPDNRGGTLRDIYAQRVQSDGTLGGDAAVPMSRPLSLILLAAGLAGIAMLGVVASPRTRKAAF